MQTLECIGRAQVNSKDTRYKMVDDKNNVVWLSRDDIKTGIKSGELKVTNLKLSADGRLIKDNSFESGATKIRFNAAAKDGVGIAVNGRLIPGTEGVYANLKASTSSYVAIGVHGENPGCYPFLDRLFVLNKKTGDYDVIYVYQAIGDERHYGKESKLKRVYFRYKKLYIESDIHRARVNIETILAPELKVGLVKKPKYNASKTETYYNYLITDGLGVVMELKSDLVTFGQIFNLKGFNAVYDNIKVEWYDKFNKTYLLALSSKSTDRFEVRCGEILTDEQRKALRDTILGMIAKVFPNHPYFFKKTQGVEVIS